MGAETLEATEEQARRGSLFVARVGRESTASEGDPIEPAAMVEPLGFFDMPTGGAILEQALS